MAPSLLPSARAESFEKAKAVFSKPPPQMSEEDKRRSEEAVKQLGASFGEPDSIGARLLSKMGFGAAGGSGLGVREQGIVAPVDPKVRVSPILPLYT